MSRIIKDLDEFRAAAKVRRHELYAAGYSPEQVRCAMQPAVDAFCKPSSIDAALAEAMAAMPQVPA